MISVKKEEYSPNFALSEGKRVAFIAGLRLPYLTTEDLRGLSELQWELL
jgi:hypothetical protein